LRKISQLVKIKIVMQMAESGDALQLSVCFGERNDALNCAGSIENPNFVGTKARAALCVVDCPS